MAPFCNPASVARPQALQLSLVIINIILLSANTAEKLQSRRPHMGNELHTFTHD
jgi:hypothetical protein